MHLNIGQRILTGFAVVILMTIGLGLYQLSNVGHIRDVVQTMVRSDFEILTTVQQIDVSQGEMRFLKERTWVLYLLGKSGVAADEWTSAMQQWEAARTQTLSQIDEQIKYATDRARTTQSPKRAELLSRIAENSKEQRQVLQQITTGVRHFAEEIKSGSEPHVQNNLSSIDQLRIKFSSLVEKSTEITKELSVAARSKINQLYTETVQSLVTALVGVVAIGLIAIWLLYRSINRPLVGFMSFVQSIGGGDLSQRTENTSRDELGRLGHTLNGMVENLANMAGQSRTAAKQLNAATAEMQASAQQQAASTGEQSAAIQQITSTLEEITQSGAQISDRAKSVATTAEATMTAGRSGGEAVSETARSMVKIGEQAEAVASNIVALTEKTHSIGEIIASVNDIAERSNLLALNAAIEAAAAGEHGQSFTVVAEEMKNLADQAKNATRQVGDLLGDIQKGISASVMQTEEAVKLVEAGRLQVETTESIIHGLVESVEDSISTFQQIIAGSNQQQIGIEQVTQAIRNIQVASEQMSAGIRDLEQSAGNLSSLSGDLEQSVDRYVV